MRATVKKWGNSLAVRIPKVISDDLNIKNNTELEILAEDGCLILTPRAERYTLAALLSGVTDQNLHDEIGTRGSMGREEW